jgi:hypothetical protein
LGVSLQEQGSSRRGLMIEGVAMLRGEGIRYRAVLLPLSENGATIDHVLGAMNYRLLRTNGALSTRFNLQRPSRQVSPLGGPDRPLAGPRILNRPAIIQ